MLYLQYQKLIAQLERLTEEPYAGELEDFIMEYRSEIKRQSARSFIPEVCLLKKRNNFSLFRTFPEFYRASPLSTYYQIETFQDSIAGNCCSFPVSKKLSNFS